jgi:hypothetical protein
MIGETCWPSFRQSVRERYRFDDVGCTQPIIDRQVARRHGAPGEAHAQCVAAVEGVCVDSCKPETVVLAPNRPPRRSPRSGKPPRAPPPPPVAASAGATPASCIVEGCLVSGDGATTAKEAARAEPSVFVVGCDGCGSHSLASACPYQEGAAAPLASALELLLQPTCLILTVRSSLLWQALELLPGVVMGRPLADEAWWAGENLQYVTRSNRAPCVATVHPAPDGAAGTSSSRLSSSLIWMSLQVLLAGGPLHARRRLVPLPL